MPELDANQQKLQAFLARSDVPEDAKRKAVALYDATRAEQAHVARQQLVTEGFRAAMPTPAGEPPDYSSLLRAGPAAAAAIKGGQVGYDAGEAIAPFTGPFAPVVPYATAAVGAGTAAGLAELGLAGGQRALGVPQGQAPIVPRVMGAAETGALTELVGRPAGELAQAGLSRLGQTGERLMSRLGIRNPFGLTRGPGEPVAASMAGTRGAAGVVAKAARRQGSEIAQAGQQILDDLGSTEKRQVVTQRATRAMRQALRDVMTRGVRKGAEAYPEAGQLVERLPKRIGYLGRGVAQAPGQTEGWIEQHIEHTITEAGVAERLAAHPGAYAELERRTGRAIVDEHRRAWWTATLFDATGTKGLQKGVLDGAKVAEKFDKLGAQGQRELFGDALPQVSRFIETVRGMPLGGAVPEKVAGLNWKWLTQAGGAFGALLGHGSAERAVAGAATGAAGALAWPAVPFLAAKLLTSPQGADFLTRAVTTAAQAAPTVVRGAAQLRGQVQNQPPYKVPDHVQVPP